MTHKPSLSVEIFRDSATPTIDIEPAEQGIEHIRRVYKGINIVRATRLIHLDDENGQLMIQPPKLPSERADLSIILSGRSITQSGKESVPHTQGARTVGFALVASRTAIVDVNHGIAQRTVTHESGHLFNLKVKGETFDGKSHCTDDWCIMNAYDITRERYETLQIHGVVTERFCEECADQLCESAHNVAR